MFMQVISDLKCKPENETIGKAFLHSMNLLLISSLIKFKKMLNKHF